jgi:hypothetical protein
LWSFSFSPPVVLADAVGRSFMSPARALEGASGQQLLRALSTLFDAGGGGTLHFTPTGDAGESWEEWEAEAGAEEEGEGGGEGHTQ